MHKDAHQTVSRRRVFYIPGFDPMPPRRYRELYRAESAEQAAISGYEIDMRIRTSGTGFGWQVAARIDGHDTTTDVDVLVWSDIVQSNMQATIAGTYLQMIRAAWVYASTGALWRLARLRKGPVIAALYPVAMLLVQLALSVAGGILAGALAQLALFRLSGPQDSALLGIAVATIMGLVCMIAILRLFRAYDGRFFAYYLMHDYAFAASVRGANPPELEARMARFADQIATALQDDVQEVLVVGHSSGASLAVSIVADILRDGRAQDRAPALSLLTLGHVVPMTSFLPEAHRLRADLHDLAAQKVVPWVDVTAPGDGCAFALCDPVSVSGVAPQGKRGPLVLSAAFSQTLSPARWAALRWRFFRLHFQYLCAFDLPGDYDYFQITAGPMTLATRYADRAASPSRIETPVNTYTSRAA